jgi:hypothetical protein
VPTPVFLHPRILLVQRLIILFFGETSKSRKHILSVRISAGCSNYFYQTVATPSSHFNAISRRIRSNTNSRGRSRALGFQDSYPANQQSLWLPALDDDVRFIDAIGSQEFGWFYFGGYRTKAGSCEELEAYHEAQVPVSFPIYGSFIKASSMTSATPCHQTSLCETSRAVQVVHNRCDNVKQEGNGIYYGCHSL